VKYIIKILALFLSIVVFTQISFLEISRGNSYFYLSLAILTLLLFLSRDFRINRWMLVIVMVYFLSIIFNDIPSFFKPYQRFIAFLIMISLTSPFLHTPSLNYLRLKIFQFLSILLTIFVVFSFLGIVLGFPLMIGRGGYTGFFSHSMILGPIAALSMLFSFHWASSTTNIKYKIFLFSISGISFLTSVAAGSRVALIAGMVGIIFYLYKMKQGNIKHFTKVMFLIITILTITFPVWKSYTARISGKMAYAANEDNMLVTRTWLWQNRIMEFKSSPLVGVGFASADTSIAKRFDPQTGKVEPGSSWLAILSMTGLLGFIPTLLFILNKFRSIIRCKSKLYHCSLLGSLLIFFVIHLFAEGYILSAGSGMFFIFWLLLGRIEIFLNEQP